MRLENKHRAVFLTQAERKNLDGIVLVLVLVLMAEKEIKEKRNKFGKLESDWENEERVL